MCTQYAATRRAAKKRRLKWRCSGGPRRALGWIPFKSATLRRSGKGFRIYKKYLRVFDRDYLGDQRYGDGCLAQDAVGDWYLCLPIKVQPVLIPAPKPAVGIDLGLKIIATTSDGETLQAGRWTEGIAPKLAMAQRRGHKKQAQRLHRKVKRCRLDALHQFSRRIVNQYQTIFVGDVSSPKLLKTRMAKSVLDSGWGLLRRQLQYKSEYAGRGFNLVNETFTTRDCSSCGARTGPAGLDNLGVRRWRCSSCENEHDRDINAAKNILSAGSRCGSLSAGTSLKTFSPPPRRASRARKAGSGAIRAAA